MPRHREKEAYRHHYKLGLPKLPSYLTSGILPLDWTRHARKAAQDDNLLGKFKELDLSKCKIIETGHTESGTLIKVLYRAPYNGLHDICFAVVPFSSKLRVKTFFVNSTNDKHETLDTSKYRVVID